MINFITEKEIKHVKKTKRFYYGFIFWSNIFIGIFLFGSSFFMLRIYTLSALNIDDKHGLVYLTIFITFLLFKYISDQKFRTFRISSSKAVNAKKIVECLDGLGWEYSKIGGIFYVSSYKSYMFILTATIIPIEKGVLYNFQYAESRSIRFPTFFGIRSYARKKFENTIRIVFQDSVDNQAFATTQPDQ